MSPRNRRGVFNPDNLDDLDEVLPPLARHLPESDSPPPADTHTAGPATPQDSTRTTSSLQESSDRSRRRPAAHVSNPASTSTVARRRGATTPAEGRQPAIPGGRVAAAIRVPADLYRQVNVELLSGPERPSYGQLVMWACQDWPALVTETLEAALPDPNDRTPRGRTLAKDRVPVQLQLTWDERAHLDELAGEVAARCGVRVTRTAVATAALRVALRRPADDHLN